MKLKIHCKQHLGIANMCRAWPLLPTFFDIKIVAFFERPNCSAYLNFSSFSYRKCVTLSPQLRLWQH